ncbi:cytochrome ubiquinol oxidase subunit I [Enterobacteriaceae bacterium EKM102V]|uniref:cytochrome ubiquinol oxidase subunit I n=2 Tax=Erwiniaceae TaxID=1903409 RepID=UPI00142E035A|nr:MULTISPECIES: cytochrome ubiquinol oxidase subunit I [Pantoea]KAF6662194.1 cytochrome ubiquinol oxidase subunit I [Enterobacteriaceae bacterium EKM102V]KAF6670661.1 cytochrome ubiquinol oxidase subunit I [Pantoea sp. EKM103V]
MNDSDWVLAIARTQFALTMGMHITLAALTLGLAPFLVWFEARWLWGKQQAARDALHFWLTLFSLTVAIGAASGVVMEFQFGTHWARFSQQAGGVIGPLMFYEVLVAFFLESALTGVMLFGFNKIRPGVHFAVTCLVAFGALLSAFWILAANSWMQTPVGFTRDPNGVFLADSWRSLLQAPSFVWRFSHMVVGSLIAVAVMIAGVAAWRLRYFSGEAASRLMLNSALTLLLFAVPLQIVLGDLHGENTRDYQPAKLAAMEGSWHQPAPGEGEPLRLFALPDQQAQRNILEVTLPALGSLYLRHNLSGHIKSLSEFPADAIPPVLPVFFAFRLMVGLGVIILATTLAANLQRWRGGLTTSGRFLRWLTWLSPAGFIALLSGWVVTEVGRQPWTVYGLLRTAQSVSPLSLSSTLGIFVAVLLIYALTFALGLRYLVRRVKGEMPSGEPVVIALKTPH